VVVGADCAIAANVTLSHCLVGDRVRLHPGVRIGQDGFGFAPDPAGHVKVPQLGRVIVHDDVEMGANCTVDRGSGPDTIIGAGCWFDNLVQIGHNVELGRGCIMVAQSGISGSSKLGDFVVVGGQVGIAGHLTIGSGASVAAKSGVMRDVAEGDTVGGYPAQPIRDWHRQTASLRRLAGATGKAAGKTTRETQAKGNK
jgi:UDP-3-O-[3-hydroxymyristoyl] glucosamine N-acyltransferase